MRGVLAAFGLLLVGFGALVLLFPWILNFLVAGLFIFLGCSLVVMAATARGAVTYRQVGQVMRGPLE